MCLPLGENDTAGLNFTVLEEGCVSKRSKMSHRNNVSQYGKRSSMKQTEKMSQSDVFHNPFKKRGRLVTFCLKSKCHSGGSEPRALRWMEVSWVSKRC
jgi:hypothetical protein